jgi:hypothetical protein
MEKENAFNDLIIDLFEDDEDFKNYINTKCMKAINQCDEYIKKEYSKEYDEDELSIMREKTCLQAGITIGVQLILTIQKYSKKI